MIKKIADPKTPRLACCLLCCMHIFLQHRCEPCEPILSGPTRRSLGSADPLRTALPKLWVIRILRFSKAQSGTANIGLGPCLVAMFPIWPRRSGQGKRDKGNSKRQKTVKLGGHCGSRTAMRRAIRPPTPGGVLLGSPATNTLCFMNVLRQNR